MKEAYDRHTVTTEVNQSFEDWRSYCEEKFPQFRFWSLTLKLELMILSFVRSIRVGNFALYKEAIQCLLPLVLCFGSHPLCSLVVRASSGYVAVR